VIEGFDSKETKMIFDGQFTKKLPRDIQQRARLKLFQIHSATEVNQLRIPPSNRLEKLSGNLKNFYSIRVNQQWRIIFQWHRGLATLVKITDYH
jgi:proteic killer suppression protein